MRICPKMVAMVTILTGISPVIAESQEHVINTGGFEDSAAHWRNIRDDNRFIQAEKKQPRYRSTQIREIAGNILLFQRTNGGWPKDYDMAAVLTEEQQTIVATTRDREDTSFDNHNTFPQVQYLAEAYTLTGDESFRKGAERGLNFMLAAQYPNGGVPQWFPRTESYHGHITLNDGAMMGVMRTWQRVAEGKPEFAWVDSDRREKARNAVKQGVECLLKCQIPMGGKRTGWCQQHDRETLAAAPARTFEPASICPGDTTEVLEFLMSLQSPSPEVVTAVEEGMEWLEEVKLTGIRIERVKAEKEKFLRHSANFDVVVMEDANAPSIWARHYEIGTNRPIFSGRDGILRYSLAEVERERRTGTKWYGEWPAELLRTGYTAWRMRVGVEKVSVSK